MKKGIAALLILALIAVLPSAFSEAHYHFEIVSKGFQATYWQAVLKGAQEEVGRLNALAGYEMITMNYVGPDSESEIAQQVQQFASALNAAPSAIGFAAVDQNAFRDLLSDAGSQNIPIIGFDSGVPGAPEGVVRANASTNNYAAGAAAADGMWEKIAGRIEKAAGPVRIGGINQDSTGESVTQRGLGFIDRIIALAAEKGWKTAVIGNEFYVSGVRGEKAAPEDARIIIEVRVPALPTVELCANEAFVLMNKDDLIAVFGSNQVAAEGIVTADNDLFVCGTGDSTVIAVGFDSGSTLKAVIRMGIMYGAVTQSPVNIGRVTVDLMLSAARGENVSDTDTGCAFYTAENIDSDEIAPNLYD